MTKPDEISSTEKLLELIRSSKNKSQEKGLEPPSKKHSSLPGRRFSPFRPARRTVVGIDIGHTYIRMAKMIPGNSSAWRLTDCKTIYLETEISLKDKTFLKVLQTALTDFCGSASRVQLWATTPSSRVENRCIRIPKLPRKQIPNAVYWTFTKKISFDPNKDLLDYDILGEVAENGVVKYEIMAFSVPKAQISQVAEAFKQIGYPLTGISIVPFAIQNLFRRKVIDTGHQDVCTLFVGREWSRIAIYSKANLVLSRGIKAGMRSMIESIDQMLTENQNGFSKNPAQPDENRFRTDALFDYLINRTPVKGSDYAGISLPGRKDIFQMILPALERLVRQVERTIEHYCINFRKDGIAKLYISGPVANSGMVTNFISTQLELPITVLDPFPNSPDFSIEIPQPSTIAEKEGYAPAIGMALSDNRWTPNFLFTHQEKAREEYIRKVNLSVLAGGILLCLVLTGVYLSQNLLIARYQDRLAKLNQRLLAYNPPADKNLILTLFAKSKKKRLVFKKISRRYYPLALIEEISRLTPDTIRLINLAAVMDHDPDGNKNGNNSLIMEGLILPGRRGSESTLSGYLLRLKDSPLLRNPVIQSKSTRVVNGKEIFRFRVRFELVRT